MFKALKELIQKQKHLSFFITGLLLLSAIISCGVSLSLATIDLSSFQYGETESNKLMQLMLLLTQALGSSFPSGVLVLFAVFAIALLYMAVHKTSKFSFIYLFMSIVLAGFVCLGRLVEGGLSTDIGLSIIVRSIYFIGALSYLVYMIFKILDYLLRAYRNKVQDEAQQKQADEGSSSRMEKIYAFVFHKRPLLAPFLLILLAWLPYIIATFPGTMDPYDVLDQLMQYHGEAFRTPQWVNLIDPNILINNNHPVLHTVLLNLCVDFGTAINNQNLGYFLFLAMQILLFAAALAASVRCLVWLKAPRVLVVGALVIFCVVPLFPAWAICVTKDIPFTALMLLYLVYIIRLVARPEDFSSHKRLFVELFLIILLLQLMRNNGMHVVLLATPFLFMLRNHAANVAVGVSAGAIVCFMLFSNALLPSLGVSPGSSKEVFSVPFQQTALYLREYPNDVSPEERKAIEKLLPYEEIGNAYTPDKADGVKDSFNKDAKGSDILDYVAAWAQMGVRHPHIYVAATALNVRAYFDPGENTAWAWFDIYVAGQNGQGSMKSLYNEQGFYMTQSEALQPMRDVLSQGFKLYNKSPFGLLTNMGLIAWVLLFCSAFLFKYVQWRYLVPFIPALLLLLVCILSPLNGSIRYALPYIVACPALIAYALWCVRNAAPRSKQEETLVVKN